MDILEDDIDSEYKPFTINVYIESIGQSNIEYFSEFYVS